METGTDMISELKGLIYRENLTITKVAKKANLKHRSITEKFRSRTLRVDEYSALLKIIGYECNIKKIEK